MLQWCPTNPALFAISSSSPRAQPSIKIVNTSYPQSEIELFFSFLFVLKRLCCYLAPRPIYTFHGPVRDIAWLPEETALAAVVGSRLAIYEDGSARTGGHAGW
jgi:hypothetical protein